MQREILFRGKRVDNGQWIYGDLLTSNGTCCEISDWNEVDYSIHDIDPETVGQFTGMTDISGEELFEGDIYNMGDDNIRYVIVWRNCMFIGKQVGNNSYAGLDYWESKIKKVGNIHDNKELLK